MGFSTFEVLWQRMSLVRDFQDLGAVCLPLSAPEKCSAGLGARVPSHSLQSLQGLSLCPARGSPASLGAQPLLLALHVGNLLFSLSSLVFSWLWGDPGPIYPLQIVLSPFSNIKAKFVQEAFCWINWHGWKKNRWALRQSSIRITFLGLFSSVLGKSLHCKSCLFIAS